MSSPKRPWSPEELAEAQRLVAAGVGYSEIGKRFGRSAQTVRMKIEVTGVSHIHVGRNERLHPQEWQLASLHENRPSELSAPPRSTCAGVNWKRHVHSRPRWRRSKYVLTRLI